MEYSRCGFRSELKRVNSNEKVIEPKTCRYKNQYRQNLKLKLGQIKPTQISHAEFFSLSNLLSNNLFSRLLKTSTASSKNSDSTRNPTRIPMTSSFRTVRTSRRKTVAMKRKKICRSSIPTNGRITIKDWRSAYINVSMPTTRLKPMNSFGK